MRTILHRIAATFRHRHADDRLDEEVRAHLELLAADYERRGLAPEDARRAARRDFGGVEQMKEAHRDRRGIPFVETLAQDARYAMRALASHRGFAAVAVLSLTLGIAGTTTVFSVMNGAMLRPIAGRDVADLVVLEPQRNQQRYILFNPEFEALRVRQRSLSAMFAVAEQPFLKVEFPGEPPSYINASLVSGTYFDVLGIHDVTTDKRIDFVGGARGTAELEKLVDSGKAQLAFSMFPVSVADLMAVSDAGGIMPPKSTWFEPKLRDGLLSHLI